MVNQDDFERRRSFQGRQEDVFWTWDRTVSWLFVASLPFAVRKGSSETESALCDMGQENTISSAMQGYLVDWDAQKAIWDALFSPEVLGVSTWHAVFTSLIFCLSFLLVVTLTTMSFRFPNKQDKSRRVFSSDHGALL